MNAEYKWRVACASAIGTAHLNQNTECQDRFAWRAIEARRLAGSPQADDPPPGYPIHASNARLHAERTGWTDAVFEGSVP